MPFVRLRLRLRRIEVVEHDPEKLALDVIGGGNRFSDQVMLEQEDRQQA